MIKNNVRDLVIEGMREGRTGGAERGVEVGGRWRGQAWSNEQRGSGRGRSSWGSRAVG